jgi:putative oxidoreductase
VKETTLKQLQTGFRVFLGILLLWAAVSKLANPLDFLASLYAYELPLPKAFLQVVAIVLPWIELLCGLLLLANLWTESALTAALGLFWVFVLATGQAWLRGLEISCGCFNLALIGLSHDSHPRLVGFLESPMFAFFRNILISTLIFYLLKEKLRALQSSDSLAPAPHLARQGRKQAPAKA